MSPEPQSAHCTLGRIIALDSPFFFALKVIFLWKFFRSWVFLPRKAHRPRRATSRAQTANLRNFSKFLGEPQTCSRRNSLPCKSSLSTRSFSRRDALLALQSPEATRSATDKVFAYLPSACARSIPAFRRFPRNRPAICLGKPRRKIKKYTHS